MAGDISAPVRNLDSSVDISTPVNYGDASIVPDLDRFTPSN